MVRGHTIIAAVGDDGVYCYQRKKKGVMLMRQSIMVLAASVAGVSPALASTTNGQLAGPSILGLVALGVVGAIAVARWRQ